jgi:hypothetical protein
MLSAQRVNTSYFAIQVINSENESTPQKQNNIIVTFATA